MESYHDTLVRIISKFDEKKNIGEVEKLTEYVKLNINNFVVKNGENPFTSLMNFREKLLNFTNFLNDLNDYILNHKTIITDSITEKIGNLDLISNSGKDKVYFSDLTKELGVTNRIVQKWKDDGLLNVKKDKSGFNYLTSWEYGVFQKTSLFKKHKKKMIDKKVRESLEPKKTEMTKL